MSSPFRLIFFPWQTNPERDSDWYARTLATLGAAHTKQEYPATPEEAFIASGARFFDAAVLKALRDEYAAEPARTDFGGALRVWQEPQAGHSYVIGADTANGGGDACVAHILDAGSGEQVAKYSSHVPTDAGVNDVRTEAHDFGLLLAELATHYNGALLGWEDNNMGVATGAAILRVAEYRHVYHRQAVDPLKGISEIPGWLTTTSSRGQMLGGLQSALKDVAVKPHDAATYTQLGQFAYINGKPQAPEGQHDDEVMALAVAEMVRQQALLKPEPWGFFA